MKNVYKPVAIFDYNKSKYCIVLVNNKICFFKNESNRIMPVTSVEELQLFYAVHSAIKVDKNKGLSLGIKEINNKQFEIYYDKKTGLHYWLRAENGKLYNPTEEENVMLNFKYNNISQLAFDEELFDWKVEEEKQLERERKERNQKITRFAIVGGITLVFSVISCINLLEYSYSPLAQGLRLQLAESGVNIDNTIDASEPYEHMIDRLKNQKYNYEDIKRIIDNNNRLSDEEKAFINKLQFLFDENNQYMDIEEIKKRLATLSFEYSEESCEYGNVRGCYKKSLNKIVLYNTKDFEHAKISAVVHELMHVFQLNMSDRITVEFTNEILSREVLRRMDELGLIEQSDVFENELGYHTRYGNGYDPCMPIGYLLAELLTPEQIKTYQFTCRDDFLIDALVGIDLEGENISLDKDALEAKAVNLLDEMENLKEYYKDDDFYRLKYTPEKFKKIENLMDSYYKKKFGKSIDKCLGATAIAFDNNYMKQFQYSEYKFNAFSMAIRGTIKEQQNMDNEQVSEFTKHTLYLPMYVVPRTYYSDVHPEQKLVIDTVTPTELLIDEKFIKKYDESYFKIEELYGMLDEQLSEDKKEDGQEL